MAKTFFQLIPEHLRESFYNRFVNVYPNAPMTIVVAPIMFGRNYNKYLSPEIVRYAEEEICPYAAEHGYFNLLVYFCRKGAKNYYGAVISAISNEQNEIAVWLIENERKFTENSLYSYKESLRSYALKAIELDNVEILKYIENKIGDKLTAKKNNHGSYETVMDSLIDHTMVCGLPKTLKYILDKMHKGCGCDKIQNGDWMTNACVYSTINNNLESIKVLFGHGTPSEDMIKHTHAHAFCYSPRILQWLISNNYIQADQHPDLHCAAGEIDREL